MPDPINIVRRLTPREGLRRRLKPADTVTFTRAANLNTVDLRITFPGRSPFSDTVGHSFSYGTAQTVVKPFDALDPNNNIFVYRCHKNGEPPSNDDGGEIEIEPGG